MDGRKHAVIEAGGKIYNLRLSYNALCAFRRTVGPLKETMENFPEEGARGMIWAGINAYGNQTVTLEQAGDICEEIISKSGLAGLQKIIKELDSADWLEEEKRRGTGTGNQSLMTETSEISSEST